MEDMSMVMDCEEIRKDDVMVAGGKAPIWEK